MEAKKWEDTVIKSSELFSKMRDKFLGLDAETDVDWDLIKITKEAQAEITWSIAKEVGFEVGIEQGKPEGRRGAVDYFQQLAQELKVSTFRQVMNSPLVQAKLKEWGIE